MKDKNEELLKKLDELEIDLNLEKVKEVEFKEKINCLEKEKIEILCNLEKNMEELNKAILKIKDLEDKLKESMTDKYLVKKLSSGRKPKGQRIGSKVSVASKSNILKFMKEEEQN